MNRETLQASVNYGDFEGSSEADWRTARGDTLSFDNFAEAWGVDIKKYHPIGIRVAVQESRAGIEDPDRRSSVEILALENQRGAMPEDYAEQQKEVPYVGIPIAAKVSDVLRNIERFEVVLVTRRLKGAPSFEQLVLTEAAVAMLGEGVEHVQIGYSANSRVVGIRSAAAEVRGALKLRAQPNGRSRLVDAKRLFAAPRTEGGEGTGGGEILRRAR